MPEKLLSLSMFYPLYNEQDNVEEAVARALAILPGVAERWELILVDDGSTDATGARAAACGELRPEVRVVTHPFNTGYGAALISGIRSARYEYVFYSDGDNQFDIGEVTKLVTHAGQADIVAGYRRTRSDPWPRKVNAALFNLAVALAFGVRLRDIDCAFKLFDASLLRGMELRSQGALINAEILIKARRMGRRIIQVPVSHFPRMAGRQSGADRKVIFRAMKEFVALWGRVHHVRRA